MLTYIKPTAVILLFYAVKKRLFTSRKDGIHFRVIVEDAISDVWITGITINIVVIIVRNIGIMEKTSSSTSSSTVASTSTYSSSSSAATSVIFQLSYETWNGKANSNLEMQDNFF